MRAKVSIRRGTKKPVAASEGRVALARPGDPLITANGQRLMPDRADIKVEQAKAEQFQISAKSFKPSTRRSVRDLPVQEGPLKAVICALGLTLLGLTDRDIATELGVDTDQLKRVRAHTAYTDFFEAIKGEFINANSELLDARIAAYGPAALNGVARIAFSEESDEKNALKASIDLLDRHPLAGANKLKQQQANTLKIIISDAKDEAQNVKLELNGELI